MKHHHVVVLAFVALFLFTAPSRAAVVVNDTWLDGTRTDPSSPTYSENGTDSDSDGNLESAWFFGGSGAMTASVGHLITTTSGSSSASWTTYFTPEGSEMNLAGTGDQLKITWVFTPTGVNASNSSQNFRLGVANTPSGNRLTADGTPPSTSYAGYALFMNFGGTFNHARPFELRERTASSSDFLASSGDWGSLTSGGTSGNHGYDSGTQYTFLMTLTRNASGGLDIFASMTGGTLNTTGSVSVSYTDSTPNSFIYDTMGMRPSGATTTANQFDTTLFKVEFIPGATPPSIVTQPTNLLVHAGDNAAFAVSASGSAPLVYRWYFNTNSLVNNATNSTLTITNAQISDAGVYSVLISNTYGTASSAYATLSVNTNALPPSFTTQPVSLIVLVSDTATFSATATGTQPIDYQWKKNGVPISGATSSSLGLTNVQFADAGTFTVVASNSVDSVTSDPATLTVTNVIPGDLYVSPTGTPSNPGTLAQPTTLSNAIAKVGAGNTIYMVGGTYTFSEQITIGSTNSGAGPNLRKRIFAYPGQHPVLDFSSQPYTTGTNPRGIKINGHLWYLKGLEVYRSADSGIYISGKSNIVELCSSHHNRDTGIQLGRQGSTTPQADWPSYNLILNCDSYDNYDEPPGPGENADGIDCKLTTGPGNVIRGCISHNNIDDGYDLFTDSSTGAIDPVTIDQCISYNNGTLTDGTSNSAGDRNGFKLGGTDISVQHTVTRCIAFGNGKNGFTFNSNPAAMRIINNLAWNNVEGNYKFDLAGPIFYNNLSFWTSGSGVNDRYGGSSGIATGPSNIFWYNGATKNDSGLTVSSASFVSITVPPGGFTRNADGSINYGNFAKLVNGSPLINAGTLPQPIPSRCLTTPPPTTKALLISAPSRFIPLRRHRFWPTRLRKPC